MPAPPPHRPQRHSTSTPEDYFRGVSPLCRRILEDMTMIREAYGEKWNELSYADQCKILDQTIVDEATVRRYETCSFTGPEVEYFPKLKLPTGQKIVSDEKLSARGYSCSWRDEHSAPFSWHTRSQMDLTFETPPATPPQHSPHSSPESRSSVKYGVVPQKYSQRVDDPNGSASATSQSVRIPPFLWHYAPQTDLKPAPDPPDLVLASISLRKDSNIVTPLVLRGTSFKHMVVKTTNNEESYSTGFLGWVRGALSALTGTCVPIQPCGAISKGTLYPSSPFIHPELRPPHVIAKGAASSPPTMTQPRRVRDGSEESLFKVSKDATLKSECLSTDTTFTSDIKSDRGSHGHFDSTESSKRDSQNLNRSLMSNRNSVMYGTFLEEECQEEALLHQDPNKNLSSGVGHKSIGDEGYQVHDVSPPGISTSGKELSSSNEWDEDRPLINLSTNNQNSIPKTGFDFLDNW